MTQQRSLLDAKPPPTAPTIALRDYQREALDAVRAAPAAGVTRPLVVLPTGTGKTVIFAMLARELGARTLILAHRDELLQQAADKLRMVDPAAAVGLVKAERDEHRAPIVVASVQTLAHARRLARVRPDFGLVVVDEAHHVVSASYRTILRHVGAFDAGGPLTVGVTATPDRGDGVGLGAVFQRVVYERDLLAMIRAGYLCDPRGIQVGLAADFRALKVRGGDVADEASARLLLGADAPAVA
ncbi:MAG: DEAD/DEAH box helicase family protein, partial [Chloroflexota bacterium]|nr:DEAD/DEAH box helicase family protein [Chloroflexota bacterium]